MLRSITAFVGLAMIVVGIGIFLTVGALYAYGQYERFRFEQELATATAPEYASLLGPVDTASPGQKRASNPQQEPASETVDDAEEATQQTVDVAPPSIEATPQAADEAQPSIEATAQSVDVAPSSTEVATPREEVAVSDASPLPPPRLRPTAPPTRIVIPKIRVDSVIREAKIVNGEWQVPKFVVGHLERTANPGQNSNVVLSGHLESLSSGNVFARLGEMRVGDKLTLFVGDQEIRYKITETKVVENTDMSVVQPTPQETLTLVTCTGTFNIATRDYSHRFIAIAQPDEVDVPE